MTPPKKSQILIVDDYPTNIKVLSDFLTTSGFEVLVARDGENALKKLERVTPALVLLDVLMPGIDGFETCRRLKERASTCEIPVIFMTALADPVDKVKGLTLGAVDYITKPFQQEEVLARINLHLKLQHLTQELAAQNAQLQQEARSRQLAETALRASEEKFAKAFRSSPALMVILTLDEGRILEANQNFFYSLGYPPEEVLNQVFAELPICREAERMAAFFETLRSHQSVHHYECQLYKRSNEARHFLLSAEVIEVHEADCILAMAFDITDCKRYATELENSRTHAEMANQAKSQFLANISHELRTPLNTILGYTQLMDREEALTEAQKEYLSIISRSSDHLLTLINDVLDMAKIESGRQSLMLSFCDLSFFLDSLLAMLTPKATEKGLVLYLDPESAFSRYIRTDEVKLRQTLINLISNGIKFTSQGHVKVRVSQQSLTAGMPLTSPQEHPLLLRFEIQDTGSGIAAEDIATLFDPFVQTETGRRTQEGTGLGLAISQRFVEIMGGTIAVDSQPGQGSTFQVNLPMIAIEASAVAPSGPQQRVLGLAPGQPSYRILVVEDQPSNRQLLVKLLERVGFTVQSADSGTTAIAQCLQWMPDLVCMDIRMTGVSGYEATRQIKQFYPPGRDRCPKVVAITANAFEEEQRAALAAGCDAFIRKPIQEAVLFETLTAQLGVQYVYQPLAEGAEDSSSPARQPRSGPGALPEHVVTDLWELAGGDQAFLMEYLDEQLKTLPQLWQRIQDSSNQQSAEELNLAAHTLKGTAMTFGAEGLAADCLALERSSELGSPALLAEQHRRLETALTELVEAINTLRQTLKAALSS